MIHHLLAWRTKISKAFGSRSQAMQEESAETEQEEKSPDIAQNVDGSLTIEKVDCLREFSIIFKDRFAQNKQDCFILYQNLVNWAIREWFASGKSKTEELIAVFRLSSIAGLTVDQLDFWSQCARSMVFKKNTVTSQELFDALRNYEPPFTRWTLIKDYWSRDQRGGTLLHSESFRFIEQYLKEKNKTGIDFFEDTLFDRDASNATSFIVCVLRKLGMDGEKMLVNFGVCSEKWPAEPTD